MSAHVEGTIVQNTKIAAVKYEYAPRTANDDRPWRAIDVPPLIQLLVGVEGDGVRFNAEDIQESIDAGGLIIIHIP